MEYYAHYDTITGDIKGFFGDEIHGLENIPAPKIKISLQEWRDCLENPGRRKISLENLKIVETIPPQPTKTELLKSIRAARDGFLQATDWTQIPDVPMDAAQRELWRKYRQALRDFPEICNPYNPTWPDEPKEV